MLFGKVYVQKLSNGYRLGFDLFHKPVDEVAEEACVDSSEIPSTSSPNFDYVEFQGSEVKSTEEVSCSSKISSFSTDSGIGQEKVEDQDKVASFLQKLFLHVHELRSCPVKLVVVDFDLDPHGLPDYIRRPDTIVYTNCPGQKIFGVVTVQDKEDLYELLSDSDEFNEFSMANSYYVLPDRQMKMLDYYESYLQSEGAYASSHEVIKLESSKNSSTSCDSISYATWYNPSFAQESLETLAQDFSLAIEFVETMPKFEKSFKNLTLL